MALALDLPTPVGLEAACLMLMDVAKMLLAHLAAGRDTVLNRDLTGPLSRLLLGFHDPLLLDCAVLGLEGLLLTKEGMRDKDRADAAVLRRTLEALRAGR